MEISSLINDAYEKMEQGYYSDALEIFDNILKINKNEKALFGKIKCLYLLDEFSSVVNLCDEYLFEYGENFYIRLHKGLSKKVLGDYFSAIKDFQKIIEEYSDCFHAYFEMGNCFKTLNYFQKAIDSYDKAIALKNDYEVAYIERGYAKFYLNLPIEESFKDMQTALFYSQNGVVELSYCAEMALICGQYQKALEFVNQALDLYKNRNISYECLLFKSVILYCLGKKDEALSFFQKGYDFYKNFSDYYKSQIDKISVCCENISSCEHICLKVDSLKNILKVFELLKLELNTNAKHYCTFCKKGLLDNSEYVEQDKLFICKECLELCKELLEEESCTTEYVTFLPDEENKDDVVCAFCGRYPKDTQKVIKVDNVAICNGCVGVCDNVLKHKTRFVDEYLKAMQQCTPKIQSIYDDAEEDDKSKKWFFPFSWEYILSVLLIIISLLLFFAKHINFFDLYKRNSSVEYTQNFK